MQIVLPREADAAVDLQTVARNEALAFTRSRICHRSGDGPTVVVLRDRQRGVVTQRRRLLDLEVHVGEAVLQGLERSDRLVELLALLGVLEGLLEDRSARG